MVSKRPSKKKQPLRVVEIAAHFAVDRGMIYQWFRKGCPRGTIAEISKWRAASLQTNRLPIQQRLDWEGKPGSVDPARSTLIERKLEADLRRSMAEGDFRELRNRERRKTLIDRREVEREVSALLIRIKERLLAVPDEFETRFPLEVRQQCKADLTEFMRQLLLEMSRWKIMDESTDDLLIAAAARLLAERTTTVSHE